MSLRSRFCNSLALSLGQFLRILEMPECLGSGLDIEPLGNAWGQVLTLNLSDGKPQESNVKCQDLTPYSSFFRNPRGVYGVKFIGIGLFGSLDQAF